MHGVSPDGTHNPLRQVRESLRAFQFVVDEICERARQVSRGIPQRPTSIGSGCPVHGFLGELQGQRFVVQPAGTVQEKVDTNSIRSLEKHRVHGRIAFVYGANPQLQTWISGPPAGEEV
jgi:hypothetical protein